MNTPPTAPHGTAPLWIIVLVWIVLPLLFGALVWKVRQDQLRRTISGGGGGGPMGSSDAGGSDAARDQAESSCQERGNSGYLDHGLHEEPA